MTEQEEMLVISEEEYREFERKRVIDLFRQRKSIDDQLLVSLSALADKEQSQEVYNIVHKLHGSVLNGDMISLEGVNELLDDKQQELFHARKHKPFYKSAQIFDDYKDNPVQKVLVKTKKINKRKMKKDGNTAKHHLESIIQAKHIREMEIRLAALEKKVDKIEAKTQVYDKVIGKYLDYDIVRASLPENILDILVKKDVSPAKIDLYALKYHNPRLSQPVLADLVDKTDRTVRNWLNEVHEVLEQNEFQK